MGIVFSEPTNQSGLIELLGDLTGTNAASSSSYSLYKKTRDINSAYAQFMMLAIRAAGKWQVDDTNQTDYNIIKIDLAANQRDYPFTVDGSSIPNQVLDIHRVEMANSSGVFEVLDPFDQTDEGDALAQLATYSGVPYRYDKMANGLFLDPKPNYSLAQALWVYISRTPIYFLTSDTTKKAGIPDFFHEYLVYRPAFLYCSAKGLPQASAQLAFLTKMEKDIALYYASRNKDEHRVMKMKRINFR